MQNGMVDTQTGEMADPTACGEALAALVTKIVAACNQMKKVEKGGRNEFHRYNYIRLEDVVAEVRWALLGNGVLFYRSGCTIRTYEMRQAEDEQNKKIKTGTYVTLDMEFTLTDGHAKLVLPAIAESRATDDKALQKAESSGLKYALFQNFLLQHEEDDDIDHSAAFDGGQASPQAKAPRSVTTTQRQAAPRPATVTSNPAANGPVSSPPAQAASTPQPAPAAAPAAPQTAATPIPAAWGGDNGLITEAHTALLKAWIAERKQSEKAVLAWATRDAKREVKALADLGERQFERLAVTWGKVKTEAGEWVARAK